LVINSYYGKVVWWMMSANACSKKLCLPSRSTILVF